MMIIVQSVYWDLFHDGFGCHAYSAYDYHNDGTILWDFVDDPDVRERDLTVYLRVKEVHAEGMDWHYLCDEFDDDVHGIVTTAHDADAGQVADLLRSAYERQLFPGMWNGPTYAPVAITAV